MTSPSISLLLFRANMSETTVTDAAASSSSAMIAQMVKMKLSTVWLWGEKHKLARFHYGYYFMHFYGWDETICPATICVSERVFFGPSLSTSWNDELRRIYMHMHTNVAHEVATNATDTSNKLMSERRSNVCECFVCDGRITLLRAIFSGRYVAAILVLPATTLTNVAMCVWEREKHAYIT